MTYFSDREFGVRPRTVDGIDERVWGGIYGLVQARVADGSFGWRFPEACPDEGRSPYGCDRNAFSRMLEAEIPGIEWPLNPNNLPPAPVIIDLLEFCAKSVGEPIQLGYHSYFHHYHLGWDRDAGLSRFVEDTNTLFARNGVAFEMDRYGQARRTLPIDLSAVLSGTYFHTGDAETDRLLEEARRRIASPNHDDRRDALEKLWDAFERIKTLEPGVGKPMQAKALLDRAAVPGSEFRKALETEAMALTQIGNTFRIRHSETLQEIVTAPEHIDYLFTRMFAFIRLVLRMSGRGG